MSLDAVRQERGDAVPKRSVLYAVSEWAVVLAVWAGIILGVRFFWNYLGGA